MPTFVRVAGTWRSVTNVYVKVAGTWRSADIGKVKVDGTWRDVGSVVPNIVGLSTTAANAALATANLTVGVVTSENTSNIALDQTVKTQTPVAGTVSTPGQAVNYVKWVYVATPPQPNLTYQGATGKFTISNYNASYVYTISAGTRSGNTVTLPSATSSATISAAAFTGGDNSATRYYEVKPFAYTADTRYTYTCGQTCDKCQNCGCECAGGGCGCYTAPTSGSWGQCGCAGNMCWYGATFDCRCTDKKCTAGDAPQLISEVVNGYTNGGSEWYKIT